jgi:hypothetical protein
VPVPALPEPEFEPLDPSGMPPLPEEPEPPNKLWLPPSSVPLPPVVDPPQATANPTPMDARKETLMLCMKATSGR